MLKKRGTFIGAKRAPPYSILFIVELEEDIIKESEYKPYFWRTYIDEIFFLWEHGENKLKSFFNKINKVYPTKKFTAEWTKTSMKFFYYCLFYRGRKRRGSFKKEGERGVGNFITFSYIYSITDDVYHHLIFRLAKNLQN